MTGHQPGIAATPRIAILGGGIGGIAAAAFLRLAGLPATVYEQAAQLREVGAGVVVAPSAARLLRALGVLGPFAERAVPLETGWEFRRWQDGRVLSAEDLATECERRYGERTYTAHRGPTCWTRSAARSRRATSAWAGAAPRSTWRAHTRCCASPTVDARKRTC